MNLVRDLMSMQLESNIFDSGDELDTMMLTEEYLYEMNDVLNPDGIYLDEAILEVFDSIYDNDMLNDLLDDTLDDIMQVETQDDTDSSLHGVEARDEIEATQDYFDGDSDMDNDCIDMVASM